MAEPYRNAGLPLYSPATHLHGLCSIPSTPVNSIANINFRRKHLRFITPSVPFAERRIIGMIKEYRTIQEVNGPLMVVRRVSGVTYDELGEIELPDGTVRRCQVLEVNGDNAVVQLFESSAGINLAESKVRFLGHPLQLGGVRRHAGPGCSTAWASPSTAARRFWPRSTGDINGLPMNPAARDYPNEFIQTGISTIDGLNTLVRGRSCPSSPPPASPTPSWLPRSPARQRSGAPTSPSPWSLPPWASPSIPQSAIIFASSMKCFCTPLFSLIQIPVIFSHNIFSSHPPICPIKCFSDTLFTSSKQCICGLFFMLSINIF